MLRFPLALLVLTVHVFGVNCITVYGQYYEFAGLPLFDTLQNIVYSFLREYSLTVYFFISGYVFFLGVGHFTTAVYKHKLRNRVKSLLIPYIAWNVIAVLLELIFFFPPLSAMRPGLDFGLVDFSFSSILNTFWDYTDGVFRYVYPADATVWDGFYPQDAPLWFVRALMLMSLLSPVLHWLIKRMGMWFVAAAYLGWAAVYIMEHGLLVEITTALYAFSFGAYMSISGRDMLATFGRFARPAAVLFVLLAALQMAALYAGENKLFLLAKTLTVPAALLVAYNLAAWLLRRGYCRVVPMLASASFFIYVAHFPLVFNVVKVVTMVVGPEGQLAVVTVHLLTIVIITLGLLGTYWLMQRFTPRVLRFITGRK